MHARVDVVDALLVSAERAMWLRVRAPGKNGRLREEEGEEVKLQQTLLAKLEVKCLVCTHSSIRASIQS